MRILHTGDLHLDSAFSSFGAKDAEKYRELGRTLLKNIFECASCEKCQMILIAGDLFDSRFVSNDTRALFVSLVRSAHIPVVIAPGNHDSFSENSFYANIQKENIDNLFIFNASESQFFDFDELRVRVVGYAFTSSVLNENPLLKAEKLEDNGYLKLLCAHADISSPLSRYAPISYTELSRFGFAYSALGHIHNQNYEDMSSRIQYCGFAEGRSFDELGEGGVLVADVDEVECNVKRIKLSSRAFYVENFNLGKHAESFEENICNFILGKKFHENSYLRLNILGSADAQTVKDLKIAKDRIAERTGLEYLEIIDSTLPLFDGKYLEKDVTIRGEVYRALLPKLTSADPEEKRQAILALKIALAAIDSNNVFDVVN